MALKERKP